jgi:hypothetical protein
MESMTLSDRAIPCEGQETGATGRPRKGCDQGSRKGTEAAFLGGGAARPVYLDFQANLRLAARRMISPNLFMRKSLQKIRHMRSVFTKG